MSRRTRNTTEHNTKLYNISHMKPKSNSREDILQYLWDIGLVNNYIKKLEYETIDEETLQDIIQEIWLMICELPEEKITSLYKNQGKTGLTAYMSGVIYRQIHSKTSPIYKKYKAQFKQMVHISSLSWDVFDETGVMMPSIDNYSSTETEQDLIIKHIENNNLEKLNYE